MASVTLEHLPVLSMTEMTEYMLEAMINGDPVGFMGASGAGKTTNMFAASSKITPQMLADHPLNEDKTQPQRINRVIPLVISAPVYDSYTYRGIIVTGETVEDEKTGERSVLSDLTTPMWYTDLRRLLDQNPDAHISVGIDEINTADDDMQSILLQQLSEHRVGKFVIPPEDRDRVSYMFLGNRPEDLPSSFTLIGPLAQRAWWYQVKPTANEVLEHLDAMGIGSPEVHWFLKTHPNCVFVHGLTDNGHCLELNNHATDDDNPEDTTVVPCANGVNPRRWAQVSSRLLRMRKLNVDPSRRMKVLGGAVPKPIAMELATAMEMADTFATMDEVRADPSVAKLPEGSLLQSMQIRALMPMIEDDNVDQFVDYAKRFNKSACSGIVAFMQNSNSNRAMTTRTGKQMSAKARASLSVAFIGDYVSSMGSALGLNVKHTSAPVPVPTPVAPAPAVPLPVVPPAVTAAPVAPAPVAPVAVPPPAPAAPAPVASAPVPQAPVASVTPVAPSAEDDDFGW